MPISIKPYQFWNNCVHGNFAPVSCNRSHSDEYFIFGIFSVIINLTDLNNVRNYGAY